jgi:hypothetical protein
MARVCKHTLVMEIDHVEVTLNGTIRDLPNNDGVITATLADSVVASPHVASSLPLLQLAPQSLVNKSGKLDKADISSDTSEVAEDASKVFGSFAGLAVVPSRSFVEAMVIALGFTGNSPIIILFFFFFFFFSLQTSSMSHF